MTGEATPFLIERSDSLPSLLPLIRDGAVIKNSGAMARNHLANERTYLAWIRTSLALIGASLGLLKWDAASTQEAYLVAGLGIVALITSTQRYFRVMQQLDRGEFEPNVRGVLVVVVTVTIAVIAAFVLQRIHQL